MKCKVKGTIENSHKKLLKMAKPIRATPTLRGADAIRFAKAMIEEEKHPNPKRLATIKRALGTKFHVVN